MRKCLFCKSCKNFILYAHKNVLVCFDYENNGYIYAIKRQVYKNNLKFAECVIYCNKCDLRLGYHNERDNYVKLYRYHLVHIKRIKQMSIEYNECYTLPVMGVDAMGTIFSINI